eukprot:11197370-Karenia_brevis.AAC.1
MCIRDSGGGGGRVVALSAPAEAWRSTQDGRVRARSVPVHLRAFSFRADSQYSMAVTPVIPASNTEFHGMEG